MGYQPFSRTGAINTKHYERWLQFRVGTLRRCPRGGTNKRRRPARHILSRRHRWQGGWCPQREKYFQLTRARRVGREAGTDRTVLHRGLWYTYPSSTPTPPLPLNATAPTPLQLSLKSSSTSYSSCGAPLLRKRHSHHQHVVRQEPDHLFFL